MLVLDGEHILLPHHTSLTQLDRLISASVGSVVYYGFQCHPNLGNFFLTCCFLTGVAGNAFPFLKWFNDPAYRVRYISFPHTQGTDHQLACSGCLLPFSGFHSSRTPRCVSTPPLTAPDVCIHV